MAHLVKNPRAMQETPVQFLGWEDPLKKGKAAHSSILAWRFHGLYSPWGRKSRTGLSDFHFHKKLKKKKKKDALRLFPLQIEFGDLRGVLSGPLEALTGKRSSASTSMFHDAQNELNVEGPCPLRVSWHKTRT